MTDFLTPSQFFKRSEGRPRKHFGQHFLAQPGTAARIVEVAGLSESDVAVEIGPGLGALTRYILPIVHTLHLIEVDREMSRYLRERLPLGGGAAIHEQDVLSFDFRQLSQNEGRRLVLVGNLPYNITSPLMFHLLDSFPAIERAVFMVQKEVGERFAASCGTKEYGVLSVLLGIYSRATPLFSVGPGQFYPPPKVDSLVLRIDFAENAPEGPPFPFLRKFVSTSFQKRRKTLRNSLKDSGVPMDILEDAFASNRIDPKRRPETLSPLEFNALAKTVYQSLSASRI
jgi:16S rRNA (adenine1518-N6/adenine1519-N6)-dimethyltransferase